MVHMINPGNGGSGGTVTIDPYDADTQTSDYAALTDADSPVVIPAGKYQVTIFNEGLGNITVNGDTVPAANRVEFKAFSNPATQRMDLTPEITITIPSGGQASYSWVGPSA